MDGESFRAYVEQCVVPILRPDDIVFIDRGDGYLRPVEVELGDGELTAACPHAVSNTRTTSNPRAITS